MAAALRALLVAFSLLQQLTSAAAQQRSGRCAGGGYMSVGWHGMSEGKCMERAYEINGGSGPEGRCGHVSYSSSPGPQKRTDFCQCHSSCDGPLEHPPGEKWETRVTSKPGGALLLGVGLGCTGLALVAAALIAVAVCCYRRKRAAADAAEGCPPAAVARGPEQLEAGQPTTDATLPLEGNGAEATPEDNNAAVTPENNNAAAEV